LLTGKGERSKYAEIIDIDGIKYVVILLLG
jgi:hypothetical protein